MFRLSTNKKVQSTSFTRYFHKFFNKGPFICADVKDQSQLCEIWISQFLSIGNFRLFARYQKLVFKNWILYDLQNYIYYKTSFVLLQKFLNEISQFWFTVVWCAHGVTALPIYENSSYIHPKSWWADHAKSQFKIHLLTDASKFLSNSQNLITQVL